MKQQGRGSPNLDYPETGGGQAHLPNLRGFVIRSLNFTLKAVQSKNQQLKFEELEVGKVGLPPAVRLSTQDA
jgi:hypothetical protein